MVEMAKAKKGFVKLLAYIGIMFGILGILPIIFGFLDIDPLFPVDFISAFVCSPLAIILGVIALRRAREEERAICYYAISIGAIALITWVLLIIIFIMAWSGVT
jgi:hypothetical protein